MPHNNLASSHRLLAPAKINLFLHITGRRDDGYHTLQSLFTFTDFGDEIIITDAASPSVRFDGPFAAGIDPLDNLVTRALYDFCALANLSPAFEILVTKNIPHGAGLGGASSDAASLIRFLQNLAPLEAQKLDALLLSLGADVPVCFHAQSCYAAGIGEILTPVPLPPLNLLLIYPNKPCATAEIFKKFPPVFSPEQPFPDNFSSPNHLIDFLKDQRNDLTETAQSVCPDIADILALLSAQEGCRLARLSGSGSCCFGLFDSQMEAVSALQTIKTLRPHDWIQTAHIAFK